MELSSAKTSKLLGLAGAALALCLFAGCGPNKDVQDAQTAAQQADQSAQKADAASQSAQQAAASAQASASKTEQAAADAKAAADRAEAIAAKTETSSAPVRHYHRHVHHHHMAAEPAAPSDTGSAPRRAILPLPHHRNLNLIKTGKGRPSGALFSKTTRFLPARAASCSSTLLGTRLTWKLHYDFQRFRFLRLREGIIDSPKRKLIRH